MHRSFAIPARLLALFLLLLTPLAQAAARDAEHYFFDQTLGDFHDELANAKAQGKQGVLVFFEEADCPFCHYMKTHVLNQPEVQAYFKKHFLNFSVDIKGDVEMTDFQGKTVAQKDFAFKENRVRATPVIAIFDLDGKREVRYTGATMGGVPEFMLLGKYYVDGVYKQMPFTRYKRQQREESGGQ